MKHKKLKIFFLFLIILGVLLGTGYYFLPKTKQKKYLPKNIKNEQSLRIFTAQKLSKYNQDDPKLPIYLALNGYVFDVTKGKDFYKNGAGYHYLAGKDSSKDLNLIGGDIIVRKYPVVGKLK